MRRRCGRRWGRYKCSKNALLKASATEDGASRGIFRSIVRSVAGVGREVQLKVDGPATQRTLLDALEAEYPALRGTVRDARTKKRRPMLRFYACEEDLSDESLDAPLPEPVAAGREPYLIVGAIAGG